MPNENIQDWSTTASANSNADSGINWIEHMPRADVNNSARSMMAAHAKDRNLQNGSITTTGTINAQAFLSGLTYTTVPTGLRVLLKVGAALTNTGASTLNMDSIGAVTVKNRLGADLKGGEFKADSFVELVYNGTNWVLWTDPGASLTTISVQPPVIITVPTNSVEFTDLTSDFRQYHLIISGAFASEMDDYLILRFSTDNGATYLADGNYADIFVQFLGSLGDGNPLLYVMSFTSELALTMNMDSTDARYPTNVELDLYGAGLPVTASTTWISNSYHTTYGVCYVQGGGLHLEAVNVNAMQISTASGEDLTAGVFTLQGVK